MKNRKKSEEYILMYIKKLTKSKDNLDLYTNMFKNMSDKAFDEFMIMLRDSGRSLEVILQVSGEGYDVSVANNIELAKEVGNPIFNYLVHEATDELPAIRSKYETPVYILNFRRTKQIITKKISVASNNKTRDKLSGSVSGESQAAKLSLPEIQLLTGKGLTNSVRELTMHRGGAIDASRVFNKSLLKTGKVSGKVVDAYSSDEVVATESLRNYMYASHLALKV